MAGILNIALPLACAIWGLRYFRLLPSAFRMIVVQCCLAALVESVSYFLITQYRVQTQWLYNFYILSECWLLCLAAGLMVTQLRLASGIGAMAASIIWLCFFLSRGIHTFFYELAIVLPFIYVSLYSALLYQFSQQDRPFFKIREVWLCIALIVYFAGTLPIFATLKLAIKRNQTVSLNIYYIAHAIGVIRYALVLLALNSFRKLTKTNPRLARL